jgi:thymidylate synthase
MIGVYENECLDDILRALYRDILDNGQENEPTKGPNKEIIGVRIILTNPLHRLSRSESRGKLFSCLGEFLWYLSGSNQLDQIEYYIPQYKKSSNDQITLRGAYGPRLVSQIDSIVTLLRKKPATRQAVIQLFDKADLVDDNKDVPCTCSLQFFQRNRKLHLVSYLRSNDAVIGLPHDVFCFTLLQELVARKINVDLGSYWHVAGSMHIYKKYYKLASDYIEEGFQSQLQPMPPMPLGDPTRSLQELIKAERIIRCEKRQLNEEEIVELDEYWTTFRFMLEYFALDKAESNLKQSVLKQLQNTVFKQFILDRQSKTFT